MPCKMKWLLEFKILKMLSLLLNLYNQMWNTQNHCDKNNNENGLAN